MYQPLCPRKWVHCREWCRRNLLLQAGQPQIASRNHHVPLTRSRTVAKQYNEHGVVKTGSRDGTNLPFFVAWNLQDTRDRGGFVSAAVLVISVGALRCVLIRLLPERPGK